MLSNVITFSVKKSLRVSLSKVKIPIFLLVTFLCFPSKAQQVNENKIYNETGVFLERTVVELYESEDEIRKFYTRRNFTPFWLSSREMVSDLIHSLKKSSYHGLPRARYPISELNTINEETNPSQLAKLELLATEAFLLFSRDISTGILVPNIIDKNINIYPKRLEAKNIIGQLNIGLDISEYFNKLMPQDKDYKLLIGELKRIKNIAANSEWGRPVPDEVALAYGMNHENVVDLRLRLNKMGYPVAINESKFFDRQLESAAKRFQEYHGLNPDGVFGKKSLAAINVHSKTRTIQILVNLERLRWNNQALDSEYILVNQPNFQAYFEKNGERVWESRVVIGLPSNQTAEFNDSMSHIIVNPTWHVPKSIAVEEYLPMIQDDPNFLIDNDMRLVVRGTDTGIDSTLIDMKAFTPDNFPFAIKQNPSNINALGLVKFMFPNKFSIYMHDTPMKDLFFKDERTFSHGCIRLQEPFQFAYSLLRDQIVDPEIRFQEILEKIMKHRLI
jgi:murein L,D-transpeptidase YcbB/YkuD